MVSYQFSTVYEQKLDCPQKVKAPKSTTLTVSQHKDTEEGLCAEKKRKKQFRRRTTAVPTRVCCEKIFFRRQKDKKRKKKKKKEKRTRKVLFAGCLKVWKKAANHVKLQVICVFVCVMHIIIFP